jgi:hypothetical protein
MAQSLGFINQIDDVFGDFITDGRIQCTSDEFKDKLVKLQKQLKMSKKESKSKRKVSNFMTWLDSNKRSEIKDEYFDNFDEHPDWSAEGIREYYQSKNLPLDKLNKLIQKKEDEGKEIKRPRLMSLITIKAGLIWADMSDSEKDSFKVGDDNLEVKLDKSSSTPVGSVKKGRPAGYKATQFASDHAIMSSIKNAQETVDSQEEGDSVELEMFLNDGKELFKDEEGNVYNDEYAVIGKISKDGNVVFDQ